MPPFRVVARHPDSSHPDHGWVQVAGPFDYLDEAQELASVDQGEARKAAFKPPTSQPIEEPIRPDPKRTLNEVVGLGYETKVQELAPKGGQRGDTFDPEGESTWRDVD